MTDASGSEEVELTGRLAALDAELDRLRRKIWRVDKGLDPVQDGAAELAALRRRFDEVSSEFVQAYRAWQAAARGSAPSRMPPDQPTERPT